MNNVKNVYKIVECETFFVIANDRNDAMLQCATSFVNAMCECNHVKNKQFDANESNVYFVEYFADHFVSCEYYASTSIDHNNCLHNGIENASKQFVYEMIERENGQFLIIASNDIEAIDKCATMYINCAIENDFDKYQNMTKLGQQTYKRRLIIDYTMNEMNDCILIGDFTANL